MLYVLGVAVDAINLNTAMLLQSMSVIQPQKKKKLNRTPTYSYAFFFAKTQAHHSWFSSQTPIIFSVFGFDVGVQCC